MAGIIGQITAQARVRRLKKKISIDKEQAEILGFEVSAKRSKYKIATKRAQAILSWPFPSTRDAFISRIASLQYFQQCLPGIKYIVTDIIG